MGNKQALSIFGNKTKSLLDPEKYHAIMILCVLHRGSKLEKMQTK